MKTRNDFNGLTEAEAERLAILAEECGETIQIIGKILRHGKESTNPDRTDNKTNLEMLSEEIGDLRAAVKMLDDLGLFRANVCQKKFEAKLIKVKRYLHH